jgi:hypothetical protein
MLFSYQFYPALSFYGTQRARLDIVRAMQWHRYPDRTVPEANVASLGTEHKEPGSFQLFNNFLAIHLRSISDVIHRANHIMQHKYVKVQQLG